MRIRKRPLQGRLSHQQRLARWNSQAEVQPRTPGRSDLSHPEIPAISLAPIAGLGDSAFPSGWFQCGFTCQNMFSWIGSARSLKIGRGFPKGPTDGINTNNYIPRYRFSDLLTLANDTPWQITRLVDNHVTGTTASSPP